EAGALALQCESPSLRLFKPADTPGLHIFGNRIHWTDTGCPDLTFEFSIDGVRSDSNAVYSPDDETIRIYLQEDRLENGKRDYWGLLTKRRSNSRPQKSAQVRQVSTEDPQDRIRHFEELIDRQQKQIRKVEKAIERSMRTYNALSFDENGKYIKGAPLLVSNNCQEHKDRLAKLNRKLRGNIKQLEKLKAQTR
ncbi:MAG: hypothetical protein Q4E62_05640, partial [Sutterellaceae bacterium]|nr:hypothetical protein [Sutterellaceae bacterium]